jgi:hypothetical protein
VQFGRSSYSIFFLKIANGLFCLSPTVQTNNNCIYLSDNNGIACRRNMTNKSEKVVGGGHCWSHQLQVLSLVLRYGTDVKLAMEREIADDDSTDLFANG